MADRDQERRGADADTENQQPRGSREPDHDRIARRAYERYEARGRGDGGHLDVWFDAERELTGGSPAAADERLADDENQID
jgi:hypothetical protein